MIRERRPWLDVTPWSQIVGADGYPWTVLPHWPPYQKRVKRRDGGVLLFTPRPTDLATVLVPDEPDALATLTATFGAPEVLAWWQAPAPFWTVPPATPATLDRHLRDWHGESTFTRSRDEVVAYHWQLHQQQLVHPARVGHLHAGG